MVKHVVLLYPFHNVAFEVVMVHGIMHHIVNKIAENKARVKSIKVKLIIKEQTEEEIKTGS